MPISGPSSYLQTIDEFLTHWLSADTTLGAGNEVVLPGPFARAALETLRTTLSDKRTALQGKFTAQELARFELDTLKTVVLLRLNQFNEKVRALHPGSKWERSLPLVPGIGEGQGHFVDPLDRANSLWTLMNADAGISDVVLLDAYTQTLFATHLTALKAGYTAYNNAGAIVSITIEERNDIQDKVYAILKSYRQNLPTYFAKGHALLDTLPRLTPEAGSTPDAVHAVGTWNVPTLQGKITWDESTNANLVRYEIRFCSGPDYSGDNESVLGSLFPEDPREFLTDAGLTNPGNVASFKVYVITSTGNEKGSNAVSVTRPAA